MERCFERVIPGQRYRDICSAAHYCRILSDPNGGGYHDIFSTLGNLFRQETFHMKEYWVESANCYV